MLAAVLVTALVVMTTIGLFSSIFAQSQSVARHERIPVARNDDPPPPQVPLKRVVDQPAPKAIDQPKPAVPVKPADEIKPVERSLVRRAIDAATNPPKPPVIPPPRGSAPELAKSDLDNQMLREARLLLQSNLPTGRWEEICWWPARYMEAGGHRRLMARMKIRTTNRLGALDVMDLLFLVDPEKNEIRIALPGGIDDDFAGGRDEFDRGTARIFTTQDAAAQRFGFGLVNGAQPPAKKK